MAASGPNVHVPVAPVRTDHGDTTQGRYVGIGDAFQGKGKGELVIPSLLTFVSRDTDDSPIPFENLYGQTVVILCVASLAANSAGPWTPGRLALCLWPSMNADATRRSADDATWSKSSALRLRTKRFLHFTSFSRCQKKNPGRRGHGAIDEEQE